MRAGVVGLFLMGCGSEPSTQARPEASGVSSEPERVSPPAAEDAAGVVVHLDRSSGALTLMDDKGDVLLGLRAAVRGGSSSSVSGARTGGAQTRTVHAWAVKSGDGGNWVASAEIPVEGSVWAVTLAFDAEQQVVDIHAQVRHQRPMYLSQQALVLRLSGLDDADVVDRAYRRVTATGGQLVDAWTPKRLGLFASGRRVILDAQAQAMQIAGQPSTVLEVSLEADHRDNHPLRIFKECHKVYDAENVPRRSDRSPVPRGRVR